jgi:hypothetical protein
MCGGLGIHHGFPAVDVIDSQGLLSPERVPSVVVTDPGSSAEGGVLRLGMRHGADVAVSMTATMRLLSGVVWRKSDQVTRR